MLTKQEEKKLKEIEKRAKDNFFDNTDFFVADWVNDEDLDEYIYLTEKQ